MSRVAATLLVGWGLSHLPIAAANVPARPTDAAAPASAAAKAAADATAEARRALDEAERVSGKDSREVADALHRLIEALIAEGKGRDDTALALADREVALAERLAGSEDLLSATALADRGRVAFESGRYAPARADLERSLQLRERLLGLDDALVGRTLVPLGFAVLRGGAPSAARPLFERALTILERTEGPESDRAASASLALGIVLTDLRLLDEAARRLERARDLFLKLYGENNLSTAKALTNLGIVLEQSGNFIAARETYQRALAACEKVLPPDHQDIAKVVHNLSLVSHKMGDTGTAVELSRRALAILDRTLGPEHQETLRTMHALGTFLFVLEQDQEAEMRLKSALAGREKSLGPDHYDTGESLAGLAMFYKATGKAAEALPLLERSVAVRERALGADHPIVAIALGDLARCEARLGRRDAARAHFERALAIREARLGPDHPDVAWSLDDLARFLLEGDAPSAALPFASRAAAATTRMAREATAVLPEREAMVFIAGLPRPEEILFTGLLHTGDAGGEWRAAAWEWILARRGAVLEELAARHRGGLLAETTEARQAWERLAAARDRLSSIWVSGDRSDPDARRRALDGARRDREAAETDLARASAAYRAARADRQVTLDDVRRVLPEGSVLIEWVRMRSDSPRAPGLVARDIALVLGPGAENRFVEIGRSDEVDAAVDAWRAALADSMPGAGTASSPEANPLTRVQETGEGLRRRVWDPLAGMLAGAQRLFLVPDGGLHAVDLAALPATSGRYLVETGPGIQILSTGRDLVRLARLREAPGAAVREVLAFGAPDFSAAKQVASSRTAGAGQRTEAAGAPALRSARPPCLRSSRAAWPPLPESGREAKRVAALFRGRGPTLALTGAEASEDRFKRDAPGNRILHVATHGFFFARRCEPGAGEAAAPNQAAIDPTLQSPLLLSGLVLAGANHAAPAPADGEDGVLTAEEVAALDLRGVDLAVLSACDTGRGAVAVGEGVFGLRRALEMAGARGVVMSLWPVPDREAGRFMDRFYRGRLAGSSTVDASRSAARAALDDLRRREVPEHPYLWAGFVTAGDWN